MSENIHRVQFDEPFTTEGGARILEPTIAYQTWGELNEAHDNVVMVFHALTGNTSADEWFGGLFGAGKVCDPDQHFIICPNVLGGCYGSTSPISLNPETEKKYRADFPKVTIRDIVRFEQRLINELNISGIELMVGGSMGGMQALEWCILDDRPEAAVLLGMGKEHRPWAIGISHTQRQAIYNDPNWNDGFYDEDHQPDQGLALARMIAMNSYRHPLDFDRKFGRRLQKEPDHFEVESYLSYQGKKLTSRFDAVSYVRLTQAMDSHDVGRERRSANEVLQDINIPIQVIGIDNDMLYPPGEARELADLLPGGSFELIKSNHGHDAFLIEFDQLNACINPFWSKLQSMNSPHLK